jgi:hypothetical protein
MGGVRGIPRRVSEFRVRICVPGVRGQEPSSIGYEVSIPQRVSKQKFIIFASDSSIIQDRLLLSSYPRLLKAAIVDLAVAFKHRD